MVSEPNIRNFAASCLLPNAQLDLPSLFFHTRCCSCWIHTTGQDQFGEFRSTLLSVLDTYRFQREILNKATDIMNVDIYHNMCGLTKRKRAGRLCSAKYFDDSADSDVSKPAASEPPRAAASPPASSSKELMRRMQKSAFLSSNADSASLSILIDLEEDPRRFLKMHTRSSAPANERTGKRILPRSVVGVDRRPAEATGILSWGRE